MVRSSALPLLLAWFAAPVHADFSGFYEETNWTQKTYGGDGAADWSTESLYLDSGYTGSGTLAQADTTVRMAKAGTVHFQWAFYGGVATGYRFARLRNGTATTLASRSDFLEGTTSFAVAVGDIIGFRVTAPKDDDFTALAYVFAFFAPGQEPSILMQPESSITCSGHEATFSVLATNAGEYQWQFKGENLPGETFESLTIPAVASTHSGSYRVIVRNPLGGVTSQLAQLVIHGPPEIITPLPSLIVEEAGRSVTLSASASGSGLRYRWHHNDVELPGSTSASLTLTNLTLAHAGRYSVSVANECGEVKSNDALLNVVSPTRLIFALWTNQTISLQIEDSPGLYALETSTNLIHWRSVSTNVMVPNVALFQNQLGNEARFYRVRTVRAE